MVAHGRGNNFTDLNYLTCYLTVVHKSFIHSNKP